MNIFFPFEWLANWLAFSLFNLPAGSRAGEAVAFFVYDSIKIFILLAIIIYAVSLLRTFLPPERIRKILSHQNKYVGNVLAALLGVATPFCTCSAIPLFLGFAEAGVPLGVTFSFLVASPMVNEVALALLFGLFGWKIALLYLASGLAIAIFAGIIIGMLPVKGLMKRLSKSQSNKRRRQQAPDWEDRREYAKTYTFNILQNVWLYVLIGVGLGALIHGYIPADFLARFAGADKWYAVPFAVLVGIPLYSNAAGVIPLVGALTEKGVAIGTTLAFMMAVTGLSLPEFLILQRVMKTKLIIIFASIVGAGIILTGFLFNAVLG
jgi:uncharacterized protein